jgi:hypothetical protein
MGGAGAADLIFHSLCSLHVVQWKEKTWAAQVRYILYIFWGRMRSSEAALGRGVGAQRPVLHGNELKKTGARSARARTRGQKPLVI